MKFIDPFISQKPISEMESRGRRLDPGSGTGFRHYAHSLRGRHKVLRGHAYEPVLKPGSGLVFALFEDAAYQVVGTTFYRARALRLPGGEFRIIPRFRHSQA